MQRLCLSGGAEAGGLKFQPVLPHARHSLRWLWSVVRMQGLHNLLGLRCVLGSGGGAGKDARE